MSKGIAIIPARFGSVRFPGKPLVMIHGKSMIMRVYEQALKAGSLKDVIVATDDQRIYDHVFQNNGKVLMTSVYHNSGTERCLEAFQILLAGKKCTDKEIIVNIQGDEPFIHPEQIDELVGMFGQPDTEIATLKKKITNDAEISNINCVKVVTKICGHALYFSRSPIPFLRDSLHENQENKDVYYKHIGMYAYRSDILQSICQLRPSKLEMAEKLEQLRWLEHGYNIRVKITGYESMAIDTPDDLSKVTNIS